MNISSPYMVFLHASANFNFKVFEHKTVWIQIRSYLLSHDFAGPDLDLNCIPFDETIVDQVFKH